MATVVDLACSATLLAICLLYEILVDLTCTLYLFDDILVDVGWSVSYATSCSSAGQDSCQPGMRATLLAAHLLDEILVDLACELRY